MKWGVRRAQSKTRANERLKRKALTYDQRSAALTKKSEKFHAENDLGRHNRTALKAANYDKKAAKIGKKALRVDNDVSRTIYERRAENLKYKAAKKRIEANRLSKTTGYGVKAMKYSIKSDIVATKAAKARRTIAKNDAYVAMMNRKISSLSQEELSGAYAFVKELTGS
jgi:hypothetical protein